MFFGNPRAAIGRQPDKERIDDVLHLLASRQFPRSKPPNAILKFFE